MNTAVASTPTGAPKPPTEAEIRKIQIEALAVLGGRLSKEDDIVFQGTKFILPERLSLEEAVKFLRKRAEDEESKIDFSRVYKYRPYDGAVATARAIRKVFGFTQGKAIRTFFGTQLPQLIDVETGVDSREQAPWGAMLIPGIDDAVLHLGATRDKELGIVFSITVECRRKDRHAIEGLFKVIQELLETDSIYRGKAINGAEQPGFIETSSVHPDDVVYTAETMQQLEANIWSPIMHQDELARLGMPGKRTVLLEGPYGTGKSLAAYLTAQVAQANGWTFLMCRPGKDDPFQVLTTARMYQPAVVFVEDVDTFTGPGADKDAVSKVLDAFDGVATKGLKMLMVMTTNHADKIHKGMIRPGRLDAVVHIGFMDEAGVERLARRTIGDALDPTTDFKKVFKAMDGYTPAFVKESFDRAVRYSVAREGKLGPIGTEDLVGAANGLRSHLALMDAAHEITALPGLDGKFDEIVRRAVDDLVEQKLDGAQVYDENDTYKGAIRTN